MSERMVKDQTKFFIYKEMNEVSFPEEFVWKIWIPLPETMFGGTWLQQTSWKEAFKFVLMTPEELRDKLGKIFYEGGW